MWTFAANSEETQAGRGEVMTQTPPGAGSHGVPRGYTTRSPTGTGTERPTNPRGVRSSFADFADIGFTAVKADVPEGMSATEYADWISSYGLALAQPVQLTIRRDDRHRRRGRARKRFAADQVALGLDRTMVFFDGNTGANG